MLMSLSRAFSLHTDVSHEPIDVYTSPETEGRVRLTIEACRQNVEDTQTLGMILSKDQALAIRELLYNALYRTDAVNERVFIQ